VALSVPVSRQEIQARLLSILAREFDVDAGESSADNALQDDLHLAHLDGVALAGWIEEETGLALSDDDIEQMRTIGEIIELVHERVSVAARRD
jgi:acyl carrier protein